MSTKITTKQVSTEAKSDLHVLVTQTEDGVPSLRRMPGRDLFDALGGGGSGLPPVTEADDDKVLQVVDGVWAAAELPRYDGTYSVTPSLEGATLQTARKLMDADIRVERIPYAEVTNPANGTTVIIG